jgi:hypothetical protein
VCALQALPLSAVLLYPGTWQTFPVSSWMWLCMLLFSYALPAREWPWFRTLGQLWYEIFDFRCNLSPAMRKNMIDTGTGSNPVQFAICMHPHGIIPIQAILWAAYCDQYVSHAYLKCLGWVASLTAASSDAASNTGIYPTRRRPVSSVSFMVLVELPM